MGPAVPGRVADRPTGTDRRGPESLPARRSAMALECRRRVAVFRVPGLRPRWTIRAAPTVERPVGARRATEAHLPRTLADLDLGQPARPELGDEGGQEIVGQSLYLLVIGEPVVRRPFGGGIRQSPGGPRSSHGVVFAHPLDLVPRRGLLGPRSDGAAKRRSARADQRPQAVGQARALGRPSLRLTDDRVWTEGAIAPVAHLHELVERDARQRIELV